MKSIDADPEVGDKVYYHGEGPHTVIDFAHPGYPILQADDGTIIGEGIGVSWGNCCGWFSSEELERQWAEESQSGSDD